MEVTNRFKGLNLVDRVLEELRMEVCNIIQEVVTIIISKKKKCKKAKWLSEEAFPEKERYTHLNAEFQRIARRDNKAFLSDQWKEIEENNRMGKTRDLFLEKAMAPHSSTLAWKIPWMEDPGGPQSMGSLRVGHD